MTREDAEECYRDRLKVMTRYGIGEIYSLCEVRSPVQWVEVILDKTTRQGLVRTLYLPSISRYVPAVEVSGDREANNIF
jgi:hypothetical protein